MGKVPIKWKKISDNEGVVEVNGPDNTTLASGAPSLKVYGNEEVTGNMTVGGNTSITGNTSVTGTVTATGRITANGGITGTLTGDASTVSGGYTVKTNVPTGAVFTDTKNTAGSTNSTSKLFLVGALEQSANPQTYSNSNVFIQDSVIYAKGANAVNSNGTTVSALVVDSNQNGQFNVWKADGTPMVWATGSSGQLNCMGKISVLESVSGARKLRVRHETDTTNHYGKTTWYYGDNYPTVEITGDGYLRSTNGSFDVINSAGSSLASISGNETSSSLRLYSYAASALDTPKLQVQVDAGSTGGEIVLFDGNNNSTISLVGETGTIVCSKMSTTNEDVTFSKSSGSWSFAEGEYTRSGQVVQVVIQFKGGGSNVAVGSNAIVGTINGIPNPPRTIRLQGYYSGTALMGELTTSGGFNVRILGQALNLSTSNKATLSGTYIVED